MTDLPSNEQISSAPQNEPSDEQLIELARGGDSKSYATLWARHARAGGTVARGMGGKTDADDLVSEAYMVILDAIRRGKGPTGAFRPYLFTTIRNLAMKWGKAPQHSSDDELNELADPSSTAEADTAFVEKTITVRAFKNLPERWQTVLWYTEVEGMKPSEAGVLLGMSASSVAALAYRAREGLRREWLQAHVNNPATSEDCRWASLRMGDHNRGALSARDEARFNAHVDGCVKCSILVEEIDHVGSRLAILILPLMLGGTAAAAYLASLHAAPAAAQAFGTEGVDPSGSSTGAASAAPATTAKTAGLLSGSAATVVMASVLAAVVAIGGVGIVVMNLPGDSATTAISAPAETAPDETPDVPDTEDTAVVSADDEPDSGTAPPVDTVIPPNRPVRPIVPTTPVAPETPGDPASPAQPSEPGTPPVAPPVTPTDPGEPADVTAPDAPVLLSPGNATTVADDAPGLSGTGEPGATVSVRSGAATATTLVADDGSWQLDVPLPNGIHELEIVQTDAAGNESAPVALTITVDTIALAPGLDELPIGPIVFLPDFSGLAEPNASVTVTSSTGGSVTTTADAAGAWTVSSVGIAAAHAQSFTAVQTDAVGNVSPASAPTQVREYDNPTIVSLTVEPDHRVTIVADGVPGRLVQIFYGIEDDKTSGFLHVMAAGGIARVAPVLEPGERMFRVRYVEDLDGDGYASAADRFGALAAMPVIVPAFP